MPGLEEEDCYFGANMENRPMEWNLNQAQKRSSKSTIYKQAKKTNKTTTRQTTTIILQWFELETPGLWTPNMHIETSQPRVNCQRQVFAINIQLNQLTTQPDSTPQTPTDSVDNESLQES